MRRVCVVVTARASYARIRSALFAIHEHPELQLQLVLAASALLDKYGDLRPILEADGFTPDAVVTSVVEGEDLQSMPKSTGLLLLDLTTVFSNLKPDIVVTIADRYETLATAIAASYMNIPLCHVQGGEVTGSIDDKVRNAVTQLADLHCVATLNAANLVADTRGDDSVEVTGCPSIDLAKEAASMPKLTALPGGVGAEIDLTKLYIVVLQHPVTTEAEEGRAQIEETLAAVHESGLPACWFWPNVDAGSDGVSRGIRAFRESHPEAKIRFYKNVDPLTFLRLVNGAQCFVGNSSTGIRECSFLGVPVVNVGSRQAGRERGHNVYEAEHERHSILRGLKMVIALPPKPSMLYGDGSAGRKIADILANADIGKNCLDRQLVVAVN